MADSMAWFPFYVADFLSSRRTRTMSAEQVGIYLLLLCEQWDHGSIPDDPEEWEDIARASRDDVLVVLQRCFAMADHSYANQRLEEIRTEQEAKSAAKSVAGKRGAEKRWGKGKKRQPHGTAIGTHSIREEKSRGDKRREEEAPAPPMDQPDDHALPPAALSVLAGMKHTGGKEATWATLRTRFLCDDAVGMPDDSVIGLDVTLKAKLVGSALLEMASAGVDHFNPRALAGFVRRLRNAPTPNSDRPQQTAAEEQADLEQKRERARVRSAKANTEAEVEFAGRHRQELLEAKSWLDSHPDAKERVEARIQRAVSTGGSLAKTEAFVEGALIQAVRAEKGSIPTSGKRGGEPQRIQVDPAA